MLSSPGGGRAASCSRAGQLQVREVSSALLWRCPAVTCSMPRDNPVSLHWGSDLSQQLMLGQHLPFHRVYSGRQPSWFIFPLPHIFLLQFSLPSSSSFSSGHSLPPPPVYTGDKESDGKFPVPTSQLCPSPACTSPRGFPWSLKPCSNKF